MATSSRPADPSRAAVYAGVAVLVVALVLLLGFAFRYVLLLFLGSLLAILLRAPTDWIVRRTRMRDGLALTLVGAGVVAILGALGWFFGRQVATQTVELGQRLPQIINSILERIRGTEIGERLLSYAGSGEQVDAAQVVGGALTFAGGALEAVAHVAIVIFFAIFLAAQPRVYVDGAVRLVPVRARARAREVLHAIGDVLRRWLVGQAVLMACIALLTGVGLWLIGAPLALPLALIAGLLNFIPYVGPILAAIPAVLVGFSEGPQMALYVVLLFIALQSAEGYILEPLIQRRAVFLPPAMILFAQMVLALVGGPLGVIVATPFAAAMLVTVQKLYVEDVLEKG